jgi:hypothetical protein
MGAIAAAPLQTFGYIGVEQPTYELERDAGQYQVRSYPQLIAAETDSNLDKYD